jgi:hypothetical protein
LLLLALLITTTASSFLSEASYSRTRTATFSSSQFQYI